MVRFANAGDIAEIEAECLAREPAGEDALRTTDANRGGAWTAQRADVPDVFGAQGQGRNAELDGVARRVTQAANMFRALGVKETDTIAFVLPNCTETAVTILGGAVAGIVNPINPLLEPEQIAAILRETDAKVVVTLKEFPKTDVAQKMAEAVRNAPDVQVVLEVDLLRYLTGLKKFIVPFIRPKNPTGHRARVVDWDARWPSTRATS
jgi:acyl-coenzyme A synthetase/AMP-(fatty) acid ligase